MSSRLRAPFILAECFSLALCLLALAACNPTALAPTPTSTLTPPPATATAPATALPTATPTPLSPLGVLLAPSEADAAWVSRLQTELNGPVSAAGLRWQVRASLTRAELDEALKLVVALPPNPELTELALAAPQTQFLAIGFTELGTAPNLSAISGEGQFPDQQGFIAGYIAALITPDWRVGVIGVSDSVAAKAARTGFIHGVGYHCGLCLPVYPPFYAYPLFVELPAGATTQEWRELANYMIDRAVETVFIVPGAGDQAMLEQLAQAGVNLIGVGSAAPEGMAANWIAALRSESLPLALSLLPEVLAGNGGQRINVPIEITAVNPDLLSPGRQRLAEEVLADLQAGFIDTGVDALTGESR